MKGYANLDAHRFAPGPQVGGQLTKKSRALGALTEGQPIMGLSDLVAQSDGTFLSVVDNGFGRQDIL